MKVTVAVLIAVPVVLVSVRVYEPALKKVTVDFWAALVLLTLKVGAAAPLGSLVTAHLNRVLALEPPLAAVRAYWPSLAQPFGPCPCSPAPPTHRTPRVCECCVVRLLDRLDRDRALNQRRAHRQVSADDRALREGPGAKAAAPNAETVAG